QATTNADLTVISCPEIHVLERDRFPSHLRSIRPAPMISVFPYTTLFRSPNPGPIPGNDSMMCAHGCSRKRAVMSLSVSLISRSRDRKSTRLNSSHVKISYAVFCLKKKHDHS